WGRAVGREHLDAALLEAAIAAGATPWQPFVVEALRDDGACWHVGLRDRAGVRRELQARIVVAAHGSWEPGGLRTQPARTHDAADLLGFKAHFRDAALAAD